MNTSFYPRTSNSSLPVAKHTQTHFRLLSSLDTLARPKNPFLATDPLFFFTLPILEDFLKCPVPLLLAATLFSGPPANAARLFFLSMMSSVHAVPATPTSFPSTTAILFPHTLMKSKK
jgi:hypothetical protein